MLVEECERLKPMPDRAANPAVPSEFMGTEQIADALRVRLGLEGARRRMALEQRRSEPDRAEENHLEKVERIVDPRRVFIETVLRRTGTYGWGARNAAKVSLRTNVFASPRIPAAFDGFTVLHLSDLHADASGAAMARMAEVVSGLRYDLCVLTGDYRGETFGPYGACLRGLRELRKALRGDVYAVLGNHDSILMVPDMERYGYRMLLNENVSVERGGETIHLAGVDDAHYLHADDIAAAADGIPAAAYSILLSHTPEIYRQGAAAGFDAMLSGHTHGGQICLPGGVPVIMEADMPRRLARGAWRHGSMEGYTSVGAGTSLLPVRFNCPPEVTLHGLERIGLNMKRAKPRSGFWLGKL